MSESRTNADGVIGHIKIRNKAKADLELTDGAKQFTVVEAKVGSLLSLGVRHAKYFDQASRNVACMAEVMAKAGIDPASLDRLDFLVLAPKAAIGKGVFSEQLKRSSIRSKVEMRISEYDLEYREKLEIWYENYFKPTIVRIKLHCLSWEDAIDWISDNKPGIAEKLKEYYELCLRFK